MNITKQCTLYGLLVGVLFALVHLGFVQFSSKAKRRQREEVNFYVSA